MPGIQPLDLGRAALGPMADAQKMDIEAAKAPFEIQHQQSLAMLQRAQANEAQMRYEKDRRLVDMAQGWKPKPGASQEDNLIDIAGMAMRAGDVSSAGHALALAEQAGQRKGMEEYYRAQAGARVAQTAEVYNKILGNTYASVRDPKDPTQLAFARRMFLQQAAGLPDAQARADGAEQLLAEHGAAAIPMLREMAIGQKQVGVEAHQQAIEQLRLDQLKRQERLDRQRREIALARAAIAERRALAAEKAGGGKDVASPTDRQVISAKRQLTIMGINETIEDDAELTSFASEVASAANLLRKGNPNLTEGESIQRAYKQLASTGAVGEKDRKILGVGVGKRGGYDPTKLPDSSSTPSFATEAEAEAAQRAGKLKPGTRVVIGGRPGTWR